MKKTKPCLKHIKSKNKKVLDSFVKYCKKYPTLRFWQALRSWSGSAFIYVCNDVSGEGETTDTFHWQGKNK
jgi:CRISPR/Cas system CMR-associated protein Cmr5 small subunit